MALGLTQHPTERVSGILPGRVKAAGAKGWQTDQLHVPIVLKSGSLILLKSYGLSRSVMGKLYRYLPTTVVTSNSHELSTRKYEFRWPWYLQLSTSLSSFALCTCVPDTTVHFFFVKSGASQVPDVTSRTVGWGEGGGRNLVCHRLAKRVKVSITAPRRYGIFLHLARLSVTRRGLERRRSPAQYLVWGGSIIIIILIIIRLNYSMEQSPSEAIKFAVSYEIPRILWNPKVHYHIYLSLPQPARSSPITFSKI
jgi:hypothetical protein